MKANGIPNTARVTKHSNFFFNFILLSSFLKIGGFAKSSQVPPFWFISQLFAEPTESNLNSGQVTCMMRA
jgi:hypothetical protein